MNIRVTRIRSTKFFGLTDGLFLMQTAFALGLMVTIAMSVYNTFDRSHTTFDYQDRQDSSQYGIHLYDRNLEVVFGAKDGMVGVKNHTPLAINLAGWTVWVAGERSFTFQEFFLFSHETLWFIFTEKGSSAEPLRHDIGVATMPVMVEDAKNVQFGIYDANLVPHFEVKLQPFTVLDLYRSMWRGWLTTLGTVAVLGTWFALTYLSLGLPIKALLVSLAGVLGVLLIVPLFLFVFHRSGWLYLSFFYILMGWLDFLFGLMIWPVKPKTWLVILVPLCMGAAYFLSFQAYIGWGDHYLLVGRQDAQAIGEDRSEIAGQNSSELTVPVEMLLISIRNYKDSDFQMRSELVVVDSVSGSFYTLPGNEIKAGETMTYCFFPRSLEGIIHCPSNTVPFATPQAVQQLVVSRRMGLQRIESQSFVATHDRQMTDFSVSGLNVSVQIWTSS